MNITIEITKAQYLGLRAVAVKCGVSTQLILQQFAADLAGGFRSGGSDERDMARDYVKRCHYALAMPYAGSWPKSGDREPAIAKDIERSEKWHRAWELANAAEERASREAWFASDGYRRFQQMDFEKGAR